MVRRQTLGSKEELLPFSGEIIRAPLITNEEHKQSKNTSHTHEFSSEKCGREMDRDWGMAGNAWNESGYDSEILIYRSVYAPFQMAPTKIFTRTWLAFLSSNFISDRATSLPLYEDEGFFAQFSISTKTSATIEDTAQLMKCSGGIQPTFRQAKPLKIKHTKQKPKSINNFSRFLICFWAMCSLVYRNVANEVIYNLQYSIVQSLIKQVLRFSLFPCESCSFVWAVWKCFTDREFCRQHYAECIERELTHRYTEIPDLNDSIPGLVI